MRSSAAFGVVLTGSLGMLMANPDDFSQHVDQRVRDWQPTRAERRFDEIGWAKDIRDALRLARQHARPVFLFTYDGTDITGYRC